MFSYDSIHETCISVPCWSEDVKEGQLCAFDSGCGIRHADMGESPQGVVKYLRNGVATVQIHGLVTVPFKSGTYFSAGKVALVTDSTFCGVMPDADGEKFTVISVDTAKRTATLFLG